MLKNIFGAADVGWQLHGEVHHDLSEVVLKDVTDDSVLLVKAGTACV